MSDEDTKKEFVSKITNLCMVIFFIGAAIGYALGKWL